MANRRFRKSDKKREFWVLALVSVVVIVAVFAASIDANNSSGYFSKKEIVMDSTGATFTCVAKGKTSPTWEAYYPRNMATDELDSDWLGPESRGVRCTGNLYCNGELSDMAIKCTANTEGTVCICRGQKISDYPEAHKSSI